MNKAQIKKWWPGSEIMRLAKYSQGVINDSYRVDTTDGSYTLRVYHRKPVKEIKFELALLQKITALPVPRIVSYYNQTVFNIGDTYAIVYQHIPGKSLQRFQNRQLRQVGEFLASFHLAGEGFNWTGQRERFYDFPPAKIERVYRMCLRKKAPRSKLLRTIKEELLQYPLDARLPTGPIHVDVKPNNVLFDNGELSGVIDFDNAYIGPWLLDLAKSMVWFGRQGTKFALQPALEIYHGYVGKRHLSTLEHSELYRAVAFAFLSHIFMDFYMYVSGRTSLAYFNFITRDFYQTYQYFKATVSSASFYTSLKK